MWRVDKNGIAYATMYDGDRYVGCVVADDAARIVAAMNAAEAKDAEIAARKAVCNGKCVHGLPGPMPFAVCNGRCVHAIPGPMTVDPECPLHARKAVCGTCTCAESSDECPDHPWRTISESELAQTKATYQDALGARKVEIDIRLALEVERDRLRAELASYKAATKLVVEYDRQQTRDGVKKGGA